MYNCYHITSLSFIFLKLLYTFVAVIVRIAELMLCFISCKYGEYVSVFNDNMVDYTSYVLTVQTCSFYFVANLLTSETFKLCNSVFI